ncbi:glycosyltransferase family 4 protein [uncultured Litoreibacter sp.]|uniref:glycosyltransferase family 4 protein n=1 Tax=uncultured Litoreibacter sp. TaxID=1392394 RepID=UPI00260A0837|nr:glycosyltransferase family 4 protein [uncultured Litoreibacter sp.]
MMKAFLRKALPNSVGHKLRHLRETVAANTLGNVLDGDFYTTSNADIVAASAPPAAHFLAFGRHEGRQPNPFFSKDYVGSYLDQHPLTSEPQSSAYADCDLSGKPRLLFVSHDASRTGAPAIILRLLEIFSKSKMFECFTILDEAGERLHEFEALSHTYVMSRGRHDHQYSDEEASEELARLFRQGGIFRSNAPVCTLLNSAESHRIGRSLAGQGIPIVSLIHEVAAYYPPHIFEDIVSFSNKTVFPSQFVSRAADRHCELDMSMTMVRGQGLLEDGFGSLDTAVIRRLLRDSLGVEDDAFIVLCVGTVDIRKGADLFVDTAKLFHDQLPSERPVYFVWCGAADQTFPYPQEFIQRHGLQDRIRLLPSTSEIEQVFCGGDLFFLSARADPFPCVIHEAMACALPVVAFRNGGGAPELIGQECGKIVEMGDLKAAADAIRHYADDPDLCRRQGQAAREKIASDWDYQAYCEDIYEVMRDSAQKPPSGGWPLLPAPSPEPHLVIMRGCQTDLEALKQLALDAADPNRLIVLIDGRFGENVDALTSEFHHHKVRYRLCQPSLDTDHARSQRLAGLLKNPKPGRVTLINTLKYASEDVLRSLAVEKVAVETEDALTTRQLYRWLPVLNSLYMSNATLADALLLLNPNASATVNILPGEP